MTKKATTVSIHAIRLHEKNPRTMKPLALQALCESIERDPKFMELRPIVTDETGVILGGNQRYRACVHLGMKELPSAWVRQASDLTEDQKKRFILLDNSPQGVSGEWDKSILLEEFQIPELEDWGLEQMVAAMNEAEEEEKSQFKEREELKETALQLKDEVQFDGSGRMSIPNLRADRMLDHSIEPRLYLPNDPNSGELLLWNYGSDSTRNLTWSRAIVGFYVEDYRFEGLWASTADHMAPFVNRKIRGMIAPNFSCRPDMPMAWKVWNCFRSRWVARYAQELGIPIMVDICGQPDMFDFMFDGIPVGTAFSVQIHQNDEDESEFHNAVIREAIDRLKPPAVWCYGQESKAKLFPALGAVDTRWITPRSVRKRELKEYDNG